MKPSLQEILNCFCKEIGSTKTSLQRCDRQLKWVVDRPTQLIYFLATLVALDFTLVSE